MATLKRWLLPALAALGGCDERGGQPPAQSVPVPREPPRIVVSLDAPDTLGWSQTDTVRITVVNRTAQPSAAAEAELWISAPALFLADSTRLAATDGGTRLGVPLDSLAPGRAVRAAVAVRIPPAPLDGDATPRRYVVRVRVAGAGSAEDTIHVRAGSEVVTGGCATVRDAAAQRYGVGPVRVRMPVAALRAACPEARDTTWSAEGTTERGLVVRPGGVPVLTLLSGDSVVRVEVADPRVRTAAGVGVGARLAELRARYGRPCGGAGEGIVAVWFQNAPGISFVLDSAATRAWFAEGGAPGTLPDSAAVARLIIHGDDPRCPAGESP